MTSRSCGCAGSLAPLARADGGVDTTGAVVGYPGGGPNGSRRRASPRRSSRRAPTSTATRPRRVRCSSWPRSCSRATRGSAGRRPRPRGRSRVRGGPVELDDGLRVDARGDGPGSRNGAARRADQCGRHGTVSRRLTRHAWRVGQSTSMKMHSPGHSSADSITASSGRPERRPDLRRRPAH